MAEYIFRSIEFKIKKQNKNCARRVLLYKVDGSIVGTNIVFIVEHGKGVNENAHPLAEKGEPKFSHVQTTVLL